MVRVAAQHRIGAQDDAGVCVVGKGPSVVARRVAQSGQGALGGEEGGPSGRGRRRGDGRVGVVVAVVLLFAFGVHLVRVGSPRGSRLSA